MRRQPRRRPTESHRQRVPLVLLFFGSGCAALIYQIVWLQLLQLIVGSSAVSLGILLGTFMGGMCLGSVLLHRIVDPSHHPLRVYAALELGIGLLGLLLLWAMPLVNHVYATAGGGIALRAALAAACLLPPTMMIGATLPAIARGVEATAGGVSRLGLFYAGNIAGAVFGTIAAGFYLLRIFDAAVATYVAVAINAAIAGAAIRLAPAMPAQGTPARPANSAARESPVKRNLAVHVAIGISGFTALSSEVIWTRLLSLTVGATVYAFTLILAAFLLGLGIGSSVGAIAARHTRTPRAALGWCQLCLALAMAWAAFLLAEWLPFVPITTTSSPWSALAFDLLRCLAVVLPGAVLWGASFPLALAAAVRPDQDPGRLVGGIYGANTIGAIAGSAAGLIVASTFGSQAAQQMSIALSTLSGVLVFLGAGSRSRSAASVRGAIVLAVVTIAGVLAWRVAPVPAALIAYGRHSASWAGVSNIVFADEGLNAFVAVSRTPTGAPIYHAAGKVQASSEGEDLRLQRMLAHFSHLLSDRPARVLVIGLGAGITAGAIAIAPPVERLTVVEIERLAPAVSHHFADYNYRVTENPKVRIAIDDARHYLLTSDEKFDVITSDLVDPWVRGTAALFTEEFFETVKSHLAPGGVVTMFVQLYLSNVESVKSEIATFARVFPNTLIWGNTVGGQGYDLVLTARIDSTKIDIDRMQRTLDRPDYAAVAHSLRDIGVASAVDLLAHYAGSARDLQAWLADGAINRDRNLRLQYLAGMGLDLQQSAPIYAGMVRHARFPDDVITGSAEALRALQDAIARARIHAPGRSQ